MRSNIARLTLVLSAFAALSPGLLGCSADAAEVDSTVQLPLRATSNAGTIYELRNANLEFSGASSFSVAAQPGDPQLLVDVEPGSYLIRLKDWWQLVNVETGQVVDDVVLVGPNPITSTVTAQETVSIAFVFGIGDSFIEFGKGQVEVNLTILEEECGECPGSCTNGTCDDETPPASCDGSPHGMVQSRIRYEEAWVSSTQSCESEEQERTCLDGAWTNWSGSFDQLECQEQDSTSGHCSSYNVWGLSTLRRVTWNGIALRSGKASP